LGADNTDSWTVQTPPNLSYVANSLAPVSASIGTYYQFQVQIRNSGQAAIALDPATTTFQFTAQGQPAFTAALDATGNTIIAGGTTSTALTFQSKKIHSKIPKGQYAPQVILNGTQNGAPFSQSSSLSNVLNIVDAALLESVAITTSQDVVTQGMRKRWFVYLHVKNNSGASVTFDSASVQFFKIGGDGNADTSYQLAPITGFASGPQLAASATDSVICPIEVTGQTAGYMAIFAKVFVEGLNTPAESNGTQKSILVQTPAKLSIALQTSQQKVTVGQTQPWQVIMKAKNTGESAAKACFVPDLTDSTRISLTTTAGYQVTTPTTEIIISGEDSIIFNVEKTGTVSGDKIITGRLFAREINSDSVHSAIASTQITVQPQAKVQIATVDLDEVFNVNPSSNVDTVNTLQTFLVKVGVEQTVSGAEAVDTVWVRLENQLGGTQIEKTVQPLADLNSLLAFKATAASVAQKAILNATIDAARSANTGANTVLSDGLNKTVSFQVQQPGTLRIDSVRASEKTVRFKRTQPWNVALFVRNPASPSPVGGSVVIESTQIAFKVNEVLQNDYVVERVTPDSLFRAGRKDTLIYKVTSTGATGGLVKIIATVKYRDINDGKKYSVINSTSIYVETTAMVTIAKTTFPDTVNRAVGTDIARVDTGQVFPVNVFVRNTGFEKVDAVWVSLQSSSNKSKIEKKQVKAGPIDTETGVVAATFKVKAAAEANSVGEVFVAWIDSAKTIGNAQAAIGRPLDPEDTTAMARIELPARLQLSLVTGDGDTALSLDQQFKVRARVKNLGQAETDNTGRMQIIPPQNYSLVGNESAQRALLAATPSSGTCKHRRKPASKILLR
jgi:hypothetical protein